MELTPTEPTAELGRRPLRWLGVLLVVLTLAVAAGLTLARRGSNAVDLGPIRLVETDRVNTGHQRAGQLSFFYGGRLLAVACPRYQRVVLYRVNNNCTLTLHRDVPVGGRAVALTPAGDRLYVLQRPHGDARHVEAGFWEVIDHDGRILSGKVRVGFDPDALTFTPDGRHALVLLSGKAEGELNRPDPSLEVFELGDGFAPSRVARVIFDHPGDDPERLQLSMRGTQAAVALSGTRQVVGIDLTDPTHPTVTGRVPLPRVAFDYPSTTVDDAILMPVLSDRATQAIPLPGAQHLPTGSGLTDGLLLTTDPVASAVEVHSPKRRGPLGSLPLRGLAGWFGVRPTALAFEPQSARLAVATYSGGIHLIQIKPGVE